MGLACVSSTDSLQPLTEILILICIWQIAKFHYLKRFLLTTKSQGLSSFCEKINENWRIHLAFRRRMSNCADRGVRRVEARPPGERAPLNRRPPSRPSCPSSARRTTTRRSSRSGRRWSGRWVTIQRSAKRLFLGCVTRPFA